MPVQWNVRVIRQERQRAFQVVLDNWQIHWLPRSQIESAEEFRAGDRDVVMTIPLWLAEKKEADYDWPAIGCLAGT